MYSLGTIGKVVAGTVIGSFMAVFMQSSNFRADLTDPYYLPDITMDDGPVLIEDEVCAVQVEKLEAGETPKKDKYSMAFRTAKFLQNIPEGQIADDFTKDFKIENIYQCDPKQVQDCRDHQYYEAWLDKYNTPKGLKEDPETFCCIGNTVWALKAIKDQQDGKDAPCVGPAAHTSITEKSSPGCWVELLNILNTTSPSNQTLQWQKDFCSIAPDHPVFAGQRLNPSQTGGKEGMLTCSVCNDAYDIIRKGIPEPSSSSEASSSSSSEPSIYRVKLKLEKDLVKTSAGQVDRAKTGLLGYADLQTREFDLGWNADNPLKHDDNYVNRGYYSAIIHNHPDLDQASARKAAYQISVTNEGHDAVTNNVDFRIKDFITAKNLSKNYDLTVSKISADQTGGCTFTKDRLGMPRVMITCGNFTLEKGEIFTFQYQIEMDPRKDECREADNAYVATHYNAFSAKILRGVGGTVTEPIARAATFLCEDAGVHDIAVEKTWFSDTISPLGEHEFDQNIEFELKMWLRHGELTETVEVKDQLPKALSMYELQLFDLGNNTNPMTECSGGSNKEFCLAELTQGTYSNVASTSPRITFQLPVGATAQSNGADNPFRVLVRARRKQNTYEYCGFRTAKGVSKGEFVNTLSVVSGHKDTEYRNNESKLYGTILCPSYDLEVKKTWLDNKTDIKQFDPDKPIKFKISAWLNEGEAARQVTVTDTLKGVLENYYIKEVVGMRRCEGDDMPNCYEIRHNASQPAAKLIIRMPLRVAAFSHNSSTPVEVYVTLKKNSDISEATCGDFENKAVGTVDRIAETNVDNNVSTLKGTIKCPESSSSSSLASSSVSSTNTKHDVAVRKSWINGDKDHITLYRGNRVTYRIDVWNQQIGISTPEIITLKEFLPERHIFDRPLGSAFVHTDPNDLSRVPSCSSKMTSKICSNTVISSVNGHDLHILVNNGEAYRNDYTSSSPFTFYVSFDINQNSPCGNVGINMVEAASKFGETEKSNNSDTLSAVLSCDKPTSSASSSPSGPIKISIDKAVLPGPNVIGQSKDIQVLKYDSPVRFEINIENTPSEATYTHKDFYLTDFLPTLQQSHEKKEISVALSDVSIDSVSPSSAKCYITKDPGWRSPRIICDQFSLAPGEKLNVSYTMHTRSMGPPTCKDRNFTYYANKAEAQAASGKEFDLGSSSQTDTKYRYKFYYFAVACPNADYDLELVKTWKNGSRDPQQVAIGNPLEFTIKAWMNKGQTGGYREDWSIRDVLPAVVLNAESTPSPDAITVTYDGTATSSVDMDYGSGPVPPCSARTRPCYEIVTEHRTIPQLGIQNQLKSELHIWMPQLHRSTFGKNNPFVINVSIATEKDSEFTTCGEFQNGIYTTFPDLEISNSYSTVDGSLVCNESSSSSSEHQSSSVSSTTLTDKDIHISKWQTLSTAEHSPVEPHRAQEITYRDKSIVLEGQTRRLATLFGKIARRKGPFGSYGKVDYRVLLSNRSNRTLVQGEGKDFVFKDRVFAVNYGDSAVARSTLPITITSAFVIKPDGSRKNVQCTVRNPADANLTAFKFLRCDAFTLEPGQDDQPGDAFEIQYTFQTDANTACDHPRDIMVPSVGGPFPSTEYPPTHYNIAYVMADGAVVDFTPLALMVKCDQSNSSSSESESSSSSSSEERSLGSSSSSEINVTITKSLGPSYERMKEHYFVPGGNDVPVYMITIDNKGGPIPIKDTKSTYYVSDDLPVGLKLFNPLKPNKYDSYGNYKFTVQQTKKGSDQELFGECTYYYNESDNSIECPIRGFRQSDGSMVIPSGKHSFQFFTDALPTGPCGKDGIVNSEYLFSKYDDPLLEITGEPFKLNKHCTTDFSVRKNIDITDPLGTNATYSISVENTSTEGVGATTVPTFRDDGGYRLAVVDDLPVGMWPWLPDGTYLTLDNIQVNPDPSYGGWSIQYPYGENAICQFKQSWSDNEDVDGSVVPNSITAVCFINKDMGPGDTWSIDLPVRLSSHVTCVEDGIQNTAKLYDYGEIYNNSFPTLIGESHMVKSTKDCNTSSSSSESSSSSAQPTFTVTKEAFWKDKEHGKPLTSETEFWWRIEVKQDSNNNDPLDLSDLFEDSVPFTLLDTIPDHTIWHFFGETIDGTFTNTIFRTTQSAFDENKIVAGTPLLYAKKQDSELVFNIYDQAGLGEPMTVKNVYQEEYIWIKAITGDKCSDERNTVHASNAVYVVSTDNDVMGETISQEYEVNCNNQSFAYALAVVQDDSQEMGYCCIPNYSVPTVPANASTITHKAQCGNDPTSGRVPASVCKGYLEGVVSTENANFYKIPAGATTSQEAFNQCNAQCNPS